jgi:hypothetical protein
MYIKLLMYLFLDLIILLRANPLLGPLEEVGPESLDFLTPKMALALLVTISGPKKASIFRAHPFQWPLKWMLPASKSLRPAPYKQQVH